MSTDSPSSSKELIPCAFLFAVPLSREEERAETLDEAFLNALKAADTKGVTEARIYRGGVLIASLAYRPEAVRVEPSIHSRRSASDFQTSTTERADRGLYATLVGDFVESCLLRWSTLDSGEFWNYVANRTLDATVVSSISPRLAQDMDKLLRAHPRYIGAVSPDFGNPLHRYLFVDVMFKDAFLRNGRVFVPAGYEGEYDGSFYGADIFSANGKAVLPYENFEEIAPQADIPDSLSARGLVTELRMRRRMAQNIHEKVLSALSHGESLRKFGKPFEWDLSQLPDAPEEVQVQASKLAKYLLDPEHIKGGSKAKFFEQALGITRDDWEYLQGQLIDALADASYENVRLDEHGIRFSATLPISGRNGETAVIETGWIVRPHERASFVTAVPGKKDQDRAAQAIPPPVVVDDLAGDDRWQAIYELAHETGKQAMEECVPKPLVVEREIYMQGDCGGAFIVINDGRTSFARWLRKRGQGRRHYPSGYAIGAEQLGQSAETAKAYADAFARVLRRNGINCRSEIYYT